MSDRTSNSDQFTITITMAITFHGVKLSKWRIKAIKAFLSFIGLGRSPYLCLLWTLLSPIKFIVHFPLINYLIKVIEKTQSESKGT